MNECGTIVIYQRERVSLLSSLDVLATVAAIQLNCDPTIKREESTMLSIHLPSIGELMTKSGNSGEVVLSSEARAPIRHPSCMQLSRMRTPPRHSRAPGPESVWEAPYQRRKRLNQNYMYRELLMTKGIYPLRNERGDYVCSLCNEKFTKEMFMWRHGVKHLSNKPFRCEICDAMFNRSDSLGRHVRHFHNSESPLL